ncbi:MAG TPA: hypothetical protein VK590_01495 [Saprospiraceae bacterium]|nr:hypothetical protein [Saprospiraceae bacterium]
MNITIQEFFKNAEPKLFSRRGYDIYHSSVEKYGWYCVVQPILSNEQILYKIDFEFGDMDEFIDKIIMKIEKENGQS